MGRRGNCKTAARGRLNRHYINIRRTLVLRGFRTGRASVSDRTTSWRCFGSAQLAASRSVCRAIAVSGIKPATSMAPPEAKNGKSTLINPNVGSKCFPRNERPTSCTNFDSVVARRAQVRLDPEERHQATAGNFSKYLSRVMGYSRTRTPVAL